VRRLVALSIDCAQLVEKLGIPIGSGAAPGFFQECELDMANSTMSFFRPFRELILKFIAIECSTYFAPPLPNRAAVSGREYYWTSSRQPFREGSSP